MGAEEFPKMFKHQSAESVEHFLLWMFPQIPRNLQFLRGLGKVNTEGLANDSQPVLVETCRDYHLVEMKILK